MRGEEGLTIVEVVVAGLVLVVGALGVLGIVDAATRNTYRAEQSQVVSNVLQRELEELRRIPYAELALEGLPAASSDPASPASRVSGTGFYTGRDGTGLRQLVYSGGPDGDGGTVAAGTVPAEPEPFTVGDVSGEVYRYVVWDQCPGSLCADGEHLKRAIVAVRLDPTASGGSARRYQEAQTQIVDPEAKPSENPGPPPGGAEEQTWTLWLTDTTCDHGARQPLAGDHQAHNTRGTCAEGQKTIANCAKLLGAIVNCPPGAPDLMLESAPPPDEPEELYDYATDIEPAADADKDKGLTLLKSSGNCDAVSSLLNEVPLVPDLLNPLLFQRVHKWVSPPIPGGIDLELAGTGTLSLWTKSVNEAKHPGKLCASIFTRQIGIGGVSVDTPAINLDLTDGLLNLNYFAHSETQWPHSGWTEVNIPLNFTLNLGLLPGRRLGVAIWVAGSGTGGDGIELMYDRPSFDSRLELKIDRTIPLPIFG